MHDNGTEFLILRISKSADYPAIALQCQQQLGGYHMTGRRNLNTTYLNRLAGHVITVFSEDARGDLESSGMNLDGIYFVRELLNKSTNTSTGYNFNYNGLQYFGGHSDTSSASTNTERQTERMRAAVHPDAMGMMYWTLTGLSMQGIRSRNNRLWDATHRPELKTVWEAGMKRSILQRMGREINDEHPNWNAKMFMPNIVIMDFLDKAKCTDVYNLNTVGAQEVAQFLQTWKQYGEEHQLSRLRQGIWGRNG